MKRNTKTTILIILASLAMTLPFLSRTDFHTKGEPREAVVSQSMLATDDWVLPTNNGGEIPYKPMMFHWMGAVAGMANGGHVTEFTARVPSAVCFSLLVGFTFLFFARHSRRRGLLAAMLTFTAFELHRAGMNARVDMVLTMFIVLSIYLLYDWWRKGMHGFPLLAILMMSGGTLTKGPVGSLLPCLAIGIFLLLRGVNFFKAAGWLLLWGSLSLLLPALWYVGAYGRGGEEFLRLAMEENFGRMTDTMSYVVHENPWWYNIICILSGFVPWTVNFLFSLFGLRKKDMKWPLGSWFTKKGLTIADRFRDGFAAIRKADPLTVLSWTSFMVILIFYTIPSSKRSVYLMPLYPFLAYILTQVLEWQTSNARKTGIAFANLLAVIGIIVGAALVAVWCGMVPESIFGGKHAAQNQAMLRGLQSPGVIGYVGGILPAVAGILWFLRDRTSIFRTQKWGWCLGSVYMILILYISMDGAILPPVLNAKSVKEESQLLDQRFPASKGNMYEFISWSELGGANPIHYFETDFYMRDRIRNFKKEMPEEGFVIVTQPDSAAFVDWQRDRGIRAKVLYTLCRPLLKQKAYIIGISKTKS